MPMAVLAQPSVEIDGDEVRMTAVSGRVYRVLGLDKCYERGAQNCGCSSEVFRAQCTRRVLPIYGDTHGFPWRRCTAAGRCS